MKMLRWIIQNRVLALKILRLFAESEHLNAFISQAKNRKILKRIWQSMATRQAAESFLPWLATTKSNCAEIVHVIKADHSEELLTGLLARRIHWILLSQMSLNFLRSEFGVTTASGRLVQFFGTAQPRDFDGFLSYIKSTKDLPADFHSAPKHVGASWHQLNDIRAMQEFGPMAKAVVDSDDGLLNYDRLYHLYQALQRVAVCFRGEPLSCLEAGVFRGKTSEFICQLLAPHASPGSSFFAVDTFEGHNKLDLPEETEGANQEGLFADTSEDAVTQLLSPFSFAKVCKGRIQDVSATLPAKAFHFIHLDMDLYAPTLWALDFFSARMPAGAVIILDDYDKKTCPGIKQALDEFDAANPGVFLRWDLQSAQCLLVRLAGPTPDPN
jgi:hypothetical protein